MDSLTILPNFVFAVDNVMSCDRPVKDWLAVLVVRLRFRLPPQCCLYQLVRRVLWDFPNWLWNVLSNLKPIVIVHFLNFAFLLKFFSTCVPKLWVSKRSCCLLTDSNFFILIEGWHFWSQISNFSVIAFIDISRCCFQISLCPLFISVLVVVFGFSIGFWFQRWMQLLF